MNPYRYKVSFGIRHPSQSLQDEYEVLSKIENIIPGRLMDIGKERITPKGNPLEGNYLDSRWGFMLLFNSGKPEGQNSRGINQNTG